MATSVASSNSTHRSSKTSSASNSIPDIATGSPTLPPWLNSALSSTPVVTAIPTGLAGSTPGNGQQQNGGNNGSQNDPNNIQSSATLYLYTFLATLILLLGVSAAIVLRSLILRRRHRRMIEEAIRNGTWIPPSARNGPKIDPTKKPKMFEVYLGVPPAAGGDDVGEKERLAWDTIMPFAVSTIHNTTSTVNSMDASSTTSQAPPRTLADRLRPATRPVIQTVQFIGRPVMAAWRTIDVRPYVPPPRSPTASMSDLPLRTLREHAAEAAASLSVVQSRSQTNLHTVGDLPPTNMDEFSSPLNVSVLIAMPSQTPLAKLITQAQALGDDEAELPYIEVGVASNVNVGNGIGTSIGTGSDTAISSGKGKESSEGRRSPLATMEEGSSSTSSSS